MASLTNCYQLQGWDAFARNLKLDFQEVKKGEQLKTKKAILLFAGGAA